MSAKTSGGIAFVPVLLRRKRTILLSGVIFAGVAFGLSDVLPLTYTSEGSLIVDSRVISASDGQSNSAVVNDVLTEVDVLQSVGLIRRAIQDYHLATTPGIVAMMRLPLSMARFVTDARQQMVNLWHRLAYSGTVHDNKTDQLVTYIEKHLTVAAGTGGKKLDANAKNSSVISIKFTAGSPAAAASVVNAMVGTYLAGVQQVRREQITKIEQWIDNQTKMHQSAIAAAEQRVTEFTQQHNMAEVQGTLTPALQFSRDQDRLSALRQELVREQAAVETVSKGGSIPGAQETLESRTIENLRIEEAHIIGKIGSLTTIDPRRGPLQTELVDIRSMIAQQSRLIVMSLSRAVVVTQVQVQVLEALIQSETSAAQESGVNGSVNKQLVNDLDARRQVYTTFLSQADRAQFAAEQDSTAHLLFAAAPPLRPDHAMGVLALVLGFFAGAVGASGLLITRAYFNTRINSVEEMELATGLPVFGTLPDFKQRARDVMAVSMITETFRAMWVTMRSPQYSQEGMAIVVTSSDAEEGKTTVAVTLAQQFAADGFSVLLVDADLRRPRLAKLLKLTSEYSLESLMTGSGTLESAIVPLSNGLDCVLSSGRSSNPVKMISSKHFAELVEGWRSRYDFVILDSPPAARVTDPILLAKLVQHIVFIAQAGRTPNVLAGEATKRFAEEDRAKMLTLLTRVRDPEMHFGYGPYGQA